MLIAKLPSNNFACYNIQMLAEPFINYDDLLIYAINSSAAAVPGTLHITTATEDKA